MAEHADSDMERQQQEQSPLPPDVPSKQRLTFPDAIESLIYEGKKIARLEWPEGEYGVLKDAFLQIYRNDKFHQWIVSEGDLLAIDWVVLD